MVVCFSFLRDVWKRIFPNNTYHKGATFKQKFSKSSKFCVMCYTVDRDVPRLQRFSAKWFDRYVAIRLLPYGNVSPSSTKEYYLTLGYFSFVFRLSKMFWNQHFRIISKQRCCVLRKFSGGSKFCALKQRPPKRRASSAALQNDFVDAWWISNI